MSEEEIELFAKNLYDSMSLENISELEFVSGLREDILNFKEYIEQRDYDLKIQKMMMETKND